MESVIISNNDAEFIIRRRDPILKYVIPIFERYPLLLLTSKYYNIFKQAANIIVDKTLSTAEDDAQLIELKHKMMLFRERADYISPAWSIIDYKVFNITDASAVISKNGIIWFTEAEGSFYLVVKEKGTNGSCF